MKLLKSLGNCLGFPTFADEASASPDPYAGFTKDDWSNAALDIVFKLGLRTDNSIFGGTVTHCERVIAQIELYRKQYAAREPTPLRRAIMDWLDHYEDKAKENLDDCKTQKRRNERRKSDEKYRAKNARQNEVREILRRNGHLE